MHAKAAPIRTRPALALAALLLPAPALAQIGQCRVPETIEQSAPIQPDGPSQRATIGGYTLALSWSPEFCHSHQGGAGKADDYQCSGKLGHFGFVLHGLWPEAASGPPPQWCALAPRPSIDELRGNLCLTPSPYLLEHEWAKHGSCMAATPGAYFKASRILWDSLHLPDIGGLAGQRGLTAGDLRRQFARGNPALPAAAIGLLLGHGGWLREVHLCYSAKFMPTACDRRGFGPANDAPVKIERIARD